MKEGDKILLNDIRQRIEIMAIRKGYVMARYKGASPFVKPIKEIEEILNKIQLTKQNKP